MKKVMGYAGSIGAIILGLIMFVVGYALQEDSFGYTFRPPYTPYEMLVLFFKFGGVILLILRVVMLVLLIVANRYVSQNIKEMHNGPTEFLTCPVCHCKTTPDSAECPNCHYQFKEQNRK